MTSTGQKRKSPKQEAVEKARREEKRITTKLMRYAPETLENATHVGSLVQASWSFVDNHIESVGNSRENVSNKLGTEANKEKADNFKTELRKFVRQQLKEQQKREPHPILTKKELVDDLVGKVFFKDWNKVNKKGDKYGESYLNRLIKEAIEDFRNGRL